jgi:glycosyltransferase involved in cell wall biosynthesis
MNILHAIPSLDPATGGPPIVAASLAAAQCALGCPARIISYQFPQARERIESMRQSIPGMLDVRLDYLPPLTAMEHLRAAEARQLSRAPVSEVDVVHLHGVWDPMVRAVATSATEAGKPFILTPHGSLKPWAYAQRRWKKQLAMLLGWRRMLNRAEFLHFLTEDEQRLAAILGLTPPGRVIPNGIFLEPRPARGAFRNARTQLGEHPYVMFLGRLHYSKGLDYLANAFARVSRQRPDVRLVVAGPDVGERAAFESLIGQLDIADRVLLTGPLYGREKLEALVDCDCFCLPSRSEGFSMVIIEAMACGAPVVISENCHFPQAAEAGIVTVLDADKIAQSILTILNEPEKSRRMGESGSALVEARFTWPRIAGQMLEAYGQTIRG